MSPIGLRVGPFEIVEEAHVPAHGSWFLARRASLSRREPAQVLVRLLGPSPSSRQLAELQRQFDALRAIDDRRVPRPVAIYEGCGALAVQAPHAAPLSRVVEARLLSDVEMTPSTLMDISLELTEALLAAHERGCVHGHLSPDAVALSLDGNLWVWGFGNPEARPTFAWLPPERARGDRATAATDQWSLAALIVALVSGQTPWSSSSASSDPRSGNLDEFIEPVASQWPALGRLVRRMLDPSPDERFPSLHPVRLELLGLARRAPGVSGRRELASWLARTWHLENFSDEPALGFDDADSGPAVGPLPVQVELDDEPELGVSVPSNPSPSPSERAAERSETSDARAPVAVVRPAARATITFDDAAVDDELDEHQPTEMADEHQPTEMAEDWIPTEMVGADTGPELPQVPPIRAAIAARPTIVPRAVVTARAPASATATTEPVAPERAARPSLSPITIQLTDEQPAGLPPAESPAELTAAEPPVWREEPAPTLPGMEAPEPARLAVRPAPFAVAVDAELDDDADELGLDDLEIELLSDEDQTGPVWERSPSPTSIQPFTDPHFGSVDLPETPPPAMGRAQAPGFEPAAADESDIAVAESAFFEREPAGPSFEAEQGRGMPWEREPEIDLPEPANDPVVRIAPWLATAASAGLVLLTVFNVVRGW